jgi:putative glutamine amidotransferase
MADMPARIAIPLPHSLDPEYAGRAIPQYEQAVARAGGEPVRLSYDQSLSTMHALIEQCNGILLPGSKADVDPARFHAERSLQTSAADPAREALDELLIDFAYEYRKPILGICYGLQSLNVFRGGSLIQHIPDFLSGDVRNRVNHEAGRKVAVAHAVEVENKSDLARIVQSDCRATAGLSPGNLQDTIKASSSELPVNSSHHQSAGSIGKGLRIVARCPDDGIIEALEGTDPDHFVLAVQWHPERSVEDDANSRAIFKALIDAALK